MAVGIDCGFIATELSQIVIHETRSRFDIVTTAIGVAQDGEHDSLHAIRMAEAVTVIAASRPP
jgi:hypothetical protein